MKPKFKNSIISYSLIGKSIIKLIVLVIVLSSCTVEQRLYRPGFHVEFNKKKLTRQSPSSINLHKGIKREAVSQEIKAIDPITLSPTPETVTFIKTNPTTKVANVDKQIKSLLLSSEIQFHHKLKEDDTEIEKERHPVARWALLFSFLIPPLGILLAIKVVDDIKKEPLKYTNKKTAVGAIIVGIIMIALISIYISLSASLSGLSSAPW